MKEQLVELIDQLFDFQEPIDLSMLNQLFLDKAFLFEADSQPPIELKEQWEALRDLKLQLNDWQNVNKQWQIRKQKENDFDDVINKVGVTDSIVCDNRKKIDLFQTQLAHLYPSIYESYQQTQYETDRLIAIAAPVSLPERKILVETHLRAITLKSDALKSQQACLILQSNKEKCEFIKKRLEQLNIVISSYSLSELPKVQEITIVQRDKYLGILNKFELILQELTLSISHQDIEKSISLLNVELEKVKEKMAALEEAILISTVSSDNKETLQSLYQKAPDKKKLIKAQKSQMGQGAFNPNLYYTYLYFWDQNSYQSMIEADTHNFAFLKLLHQKHKINNNIQFVEKQLEDANNALKTAPHSPRYHPDSDILWREANALFVDFNPTYTVKATNMVELMSESMKMMSILAAEIERFNTGIALIDEYKKIEQSSLKLRTNHAMLKNADQPLSTEELQDLQKSTGERELKQQQLLKGIERCDQYLQTMRNLEGIQSLCANFINLLKNLKQSRRLLSAELRKEPSAESLLITKERLEKGIHIQMDSLQQLINDSNQQTDEMTQGSILNPAAIPPASPENSYQEPLDSWDESISKLLYQIPIDLKQWYQHLFLALQEQANDDKSFLQIIQLLRDIHFELKFPEKKGKFSVLRAYQQLCPNPDKDCSSLIAMKLPLPLIPSELNRVKCKKLDNLLGNLYVQQQLKQQQYPREALLLEQATTNLHQLANLADSSQASEMTSNLQASMTDPRYDSLKRHRGFLKIMEWLAEFCTSFFHLDKQNPKDSYRHRFFFIATHSSQLLESTTKELTATCAA